MTRNSFTAFADSVEQLTAASRVPKRRVYARWTLEAVPARNGTVLGPNYLVPVGPPMLHDFEGRMLTGLIRQFTTSNWPMGSLDDIPRSQRPVAFGMALLQSYGDLGYPRDRLTGGIPVTAIIETARRILVAMDILRLLDGDFPRLETYLLEHQPGAAATIQKLLTKSLRDDAVRHTARLALLYAARADGLRVELLPDGDVFRVQGKVITPLQFLWTAILVGGGVAAPETDIPAIHVCAYRACKKVFTSNRHRVRGKNRFCSTQCGKNHWAAKSTDRRRAADKANRPHPSTPAQQEDQ